MSIKSDTIKEQYTFQLMMCSISDILSINIQGRIIDVGKKYAKKYYEKINDMLSSEYIKEYILEELCGQIQTDFAVIKTECAFSGYTNNARNNVYMMNLIVNFLLELQRGDKSLIS